MTSKKTEYLEYIDGMRALAVLAVIIYHLNGDWLPGGFSGVDVFFVISGFVVAASVFRYPREKSLKHFFSWFYSRRMQRILPALITCLALTFLISAIFIPPAWLSETNTQTGLFAFFGLSNFILASTNNDYFSPRVDFNPFTHTWSLGVEEQFYFIFPLIMLLWLLGGAWRRLSVGATLLLVLASLGAAWWLAKTNPTYGFYMIASRFWELGAGAMMAIFFHSRYRNDNIQKPLSLISQIGFAISVAVLFAGMFVSRPENFPFPGALIPVLGTIGVIAFLHGRQVDGVLTAPLIHPLTLYIGRLSYSLYLWHWPIFVLFRWTVGLESGLQFASAALLVALLSMASYHFIERPLRYSDTLMRMPKAGVVLAAIAVTTLGWLTAYSIATHETRLSQSTVTRNSQDWYPAGDIPIEQNNVCDVALNWQSHGDAKALHYDAVNCQPDSNEKHTVFLIGDSHAGAYDPMMRGFVRSTGISVIWYPNGGYPFVSFFPARDIHLADAVSNTKVSVDDMLSRSKPGDLLFMAGLRMPRFVDQFARFNPDTAIQMIFSDEAQQGRTESEEYAQKVLKQFTDKGVKILVEAPKPVFRQVPFRCADWFNKNNPICVDPMAPNTRVIRREDFEELRAPILKSINVLSQTNPSVHMWDPADLLCDSTECRTSNNDGRPLFFDGDHISGFANTLLLPSFSERVWQIVGKTNQE